MNELPLCYTFSKPKAKKSHKCLECGGIINKGEVYVKHSGVWADGPHSYKNCVDCQELIEKIDSNREYDEKVSFGGLLDSVFNSEDQELINKFLDIKKKRGGEIKRWMIEKSGK